MPDNETIRISTAERRIILDLLYNRVAGLENGYTNPLLERSEKQRLRTERRALAYLINKLEGSLAVKMEIDL